MGKEFLHDLNIHGAGQIQFKTTAGANAGKIDQNGNNLVLTNAVGDILLGDGSSDVFIGDGTNNVDIVFEQSGSIKGDGSAVTLTLGGANTTLNLENPNINGTLSLSGATTINNKLTFTTSNGYILFDYEPPGDTGEYSTETPLLKVDMSGTETTVLSRISEYRAMVLGADDTVWLRAGDTGSVIKANVSLTTEQVLMSAEGGFIAYGFPSNDTTWSNRNEFKFYSADGTAANNGLYIGDGGSTQFIDLSRNLKNIGSITASGQITSGRLNITDAGVPIMFTESGNTGTGKYWRQVLDAGDIRFDVDTTSTNGDGTFSSYNALIKLNADGHTDINGNLDVGGGIDVTGNITVSGTVDGVDISGLPTFTTVGTNFAQLGDVSVPSYVRINANETLSYLNASQFLSAIGGVDGSSYLPLAGGTMTGSLNITNASSPTITLTDSSQTTVLKAFAQDSNAHIGTFSSHPFIIDTNSTAALTIDTSQNATFAGDITLNPTSTSNNAAPHKLIFIGTDYQGNTDTYGQIGFEDDGNLSQDGSNFYIKGVDDSGNLYNIMTSDGYGQISFGGNVTSGATLSATNFSGNIAKSGDFTLDASGDIILDADGGDIFLKDGGTEFGLLANTSSNLVVMSRVQDKDIIFKGNDGGSTVTALTLDMSLAGEAKFNGNIRVPGEINLAGSTTFSIDLKDHSNYTWLRNEPGQWSFQSGTSGDDWTQSWQIYVPNVNSDGGNATFVELGQRHTNDTTGEFKGVKIVKRTGAGVVDGDFQAGATTVSDLTVTGNLSITGDINSYSVTDLDVSDKTITVGVGQNEASSDGSGLKVSGPSTQPSILWDESNDTWDFNYGIDVAGTIHAQNNLSASGTLTAFGNSTLGDTTSDTLNISGSTILNKKAASGTNISIAQLKTADGSTTWNIGGSNTGYNDFMIWAPDKGAGNYFQINKTSGQVKIGADTSGSDLIVYGNDTGERMFWDASESNLTINHDTDDSGLEIYTVGSAQPTTHQVKIGRDNAQYLGIRVDDGRSYFVHRQDESGGTDNHHQSNQIWTDGGGTHTWNWDIANSSGGSPSNKMQLNSSGALSVASQVTASEFYVVNNLFGLDTSGNYLQIRGYDGYKFYNTQASAVHLTITSSGNVGIGTASPGYPLSTAGTIRAEGMSSSPGSGAGLELRYDTSNNYGSVLSYDRANSAYKELRLEGSIINLREAGTNVLTIDGGNATFSGNGEFDTVLKINAPDGGSAPAMTAVLDMHGYEGRGVGIKMRDSVNSASSPNNREWFVGTGYGQSGFNIGYASDGSQSSYAAQSKLSITTSGNATFAGDVIIGKSASSASSGSKSLTFKGVDDNGTEIVAAKILTVDSTNNPKGQDLNIQVAADEGTLFTAMQVNSVGFIGIGLTGGSIGNHLHLADNYSLGLGTGSDLTLLHNGTKSTITNNVGDLEITQNTNDGDILFKCDNGSGGLATYFFLDGSNSHTNFQLNARWVDNAKAQFGNSGDLEIYHDGTNSVINNTTGHLQIYNNVDDGDISFISDNGSGGTTEYFRVDGGAEIVVASKEFRFADNVPVKLGTGPDFQMLHNGTTTSFENSTGNLLITNFADDSDIIFKSDDGSGGTGVYFFLDGSLADGSNKFTRFLDRSRVCFGDASDLQIFHNGTSSYIENATNDLLITNYANDGDIKFFNDDGSGGVTEYFRVDGGSENVQFAKSLFLYDNVFLNIGGSFDLRLYHDGNSNIKAQGSGNLIISQTVDDGDIIFKSDNGSGGTADYLIIDGSQVAIRMKRKTKWDDNIKATFGDSEDLEIYHDGSNSYINDTGTGSLILKGNSIKVNADSNGNALFQVDAAGDIGLKVDTGNANYLFGDSFAMGTGNFLEQTGGDSFDFKLFDAGTTTTKFQINPASNFTRHKDSVQARFGDSDDLRIYHDGSDSIIKDGGTGSLDILSSHVHIKSSGGTSNMAQFFSGGNSYIYANNVLRIEATTSGASVTGNLTVSGDVADRNIPMVIHASFDDTTSSTANRIIPLMGSITETTVSGGYAPHFFIAPYACVLKKVIFKNVAGSISSSFTTELKAYKNGSVTSNSSSGELTASSSAITWTPSAHADITYAAGDKFSLVYQKSASSKYWQDVAVTIVFTLTDYDI